MSKKLFYPVSIFVLIFAGLFSSIVLHSQTSAQYSQNQDSEAREFATTDLHHWSIAANYSFVAVRENDGSSDWGIGIYSRATKELLYVIPSTAHAPFEPQECETESSSGGFASIQEMEFHGDYLAVAYDSNARCLEDTTEATLWVYHIQEDSFEVQIEAMVKQMVLDIEWVSDTELMFITGIAGSVEHGDIPQSIGNLDIRGWQSVYETPAGNSYRKITHDEQSDTIYILANRFDVFQFDLNEFHEVILTQFTSGGHTSFLNGAVPFNVETGEKCEDPITSYETWEYEMPAGCSVAMYDIEATATGLVSTGFDGTVRFWNTDGELVSTFETFTDWHADNNGWTKDVESNGQHVFIETERGSVYQLSLDGELINQTVCQVSEYDAMSSGIALAADSYFVGSGLSLICEIPIVRD